MKNINDYKNGKHTIHCKTQEEWDKILKLSNSKVVKSKDFKEYEDIAYWVDKEDDGYSSLEFAIREGLTIHPAADFLPSSKPTKEEALAQIDKLRKLVEELDNQEAKTPEPKKIEFVKYLSMSTTGLEFRKPFSTPRNFKNVVLLHKGLNLDYDLIKAWDNNEADAMLYLGHYNDGIK